MAKTSVGLGRTRWSAWASAKRILLAGETTKVAGRGRCQESSPLMKGMLRRMER